VIEGRRAVREHMAQAERSLGAAEFDDALLAVGRARERDPKLAAAVELHARIERARDDFLEEQRRARDLELARRAREEAVQLEMRHDETRREIETLTDELAREQTGVFARFATDEARGDFARRQRELSMLQIEAERTLLECEGALQRAARLESPWGGASEATEQALARFYLGRWREALVEVEQKTKRIQPGFLEVVYHLYSMTLKQGPVIVRLRTGNRTDQVTLPSFTPVWRSCEFQEREVFDLYGVTFSDHPDLRRILMWDEYKDHPMRKDYVEPDDYEWEPTPHGTVHDKAKQHYPAATVPAPVAERLPVPPPTGSGGASAPKSSERP
jgi:NADH:ubiquinone oxidoreductase subunit C